MKIVRLIEIDALRGFAVLCMLFFHVAVDLEMLGRISFDPFSWPLIVPVRLVQFLFLGLVGVSMFLSRRGFAAQVRRAAWILFCAGLVSVATYWFSSGDYVRFGVLHCIGLSIPLVWLFKKKPKAAVVVALVAFGLGEFFLTRRVETSWLLWLGFYPVGFASVDYFPLLPWLAAPLSGLAVASWLYADGRETRLKMLARVPGLTFMGRHALAIYLLHQPVLYFSLWALYHWVL